RALERRGLPVTRWRKQYDSGGGESFFFRLAREIAHIAGISLPKDLKLLGKRAAQHQYGVMSRPMKAWQDAELAAWPQRLSELVLRLQAAAATIHVELAAWRQRLSELVPRLQAAAAAIHVELAAWRQRLSELVPRLQAATATIHVELAAWRQRL